MKTRIYATPAVKGLSFGLCETLVWNFNFHPPEVVSRYRDPQIEVSEKYSSLFNL